MRCFNHQTEDAVGTCKHCGKGLCNSCANDLGHGLACRGVHESAVESINNLITRSDRIQRMTPKTLYVMPTFTVLAGVVFAGFGFYSPRGPMWFSVVLGLGFIVYGLVLLAINRKAYRAQA